MPIFFLFFFNDTATTEIYTLSLHDALPIYRRAFPRDRMHHRDLHTPHLAKSVRREHSGRGELLSRIRSEEHTSELQSRLHLVCRLLLEKKKKIENARNLSNVDRPASHRSTV